jgi:hypothetical protein
MSVFDVLTLSVDVSWENTSISHLGELMCAFSKNGEEFTTDFGHNPAESQGDELCARNSQRVDNRKYSPHMFPPTTPISVEGNSDSDGERSSGYEFEFPAHFPNIFAIVSDPNFERVYPWGRLDVKDPVLIALFRFISFHLFILHFPFLFYHQNLLLLIFFYHLQ